MSLKPNIFKTPQIYFPKLFTAVSKTVPHINMTAKEAVAAGYSFRKKRHSVKATPHRTCAEDVPTDFSSDCIEIPQAY